MNSQQRRPHRLADDELAELITPSSSVLSEKSVVVILTTDFTEYTAPALNSVNVQIVTGSEIAKSFRLFLHSRLRCRFLFPFKRLISKGFTRWFASLFDFFTQSI